MPATATLAKKISTAIKRRPLLEASRNYSVPEGAFTAGVSAPTIWRAIESQHLKCFRVGRRVILSGQHLLDWLAEGGKTSKAK